MIMRSLILCALFTGLASAHLGTTTAAASPPIPDAGGAVEAFFAARSWLDRGGPGDAPIATPRDVRSAAVVLRFRGRVVGKGEDAGDGRAIDGADGVAPGPAGTPGNAGPLDRALRRALVDVRARGATSVAGIDARPDPRILTLELELAGERQPLIGRTFAEIARTIEPAECGLQIADGERTAYAPAADLLARRMAAPTSRAIVAMVGELGLPARDLPDLQSLGGATAVYGSWGIRLAQRAPEDPPIALARILPPVSMAPATRAESQAVADAVVARIERLLTPPSLPEGVPPEAAETFRRTGLRGTYLVPANLHEPIVAGAAEQAFVAWGLARIARTGSWDAALRDRARAAADRVLAALAEVDASESDPADDVAATAFASLAIADLADVAGRTSPSTAHDALRARLRPALARIAAPAALASLRAADRAVVLAAAATMVREAEPPMAAGLLASAVEAEWNATNAAQTVANAPFLIEAERRLAAAGHARPRPAGANDALDAAHAVLLGTQLRPDASRPASLADEVGAFPVAGSTGGRVSSQSLRPQVLVAMLATDPAMDAAIRASSREALGWANRFVRQLCAGPEIAVCAPAPEAAVGGILASPADASMPVGAQAMALWALAESETALAALESAPKP
jgi:hypothetical protein